MHFHWMKDRVKLLLFVGCGLAVNQTASSEVLFEESFDDQPDYTSTMHSTDREHFADTHTLPEGWSALRQDPHWSPSEGILADTKRLRFLPATQTRREAALVRALSVGVIITTQAGTDTTLKISWLSISLKAMTNFIASSISAFSRDGHGRDNQKYFGFRHGVAK